MFGIVVLKGWGLGKGDGLCSLGMRSIVRFSASFLKTNDPMPYPFPLYPTPFIISGLFSAI